jgi:hypothetical protein
MKLAPKMYALIIVIAAVSRLAPHPPNFTVIGSMALFGGACFEGAAAAYLIPLAAMLLSDAVIGFHSGMPAVYISFLLTTLLGRRMRADRSAGKIAALSFAGAVLFYAVTNFWVWAVSPLYPHTAQGLLLCYTAAIPFFGNTLAGTLVYSAVLFGAAAAADRLVPATA